MLDYRRVDMPQEALKSFSENLPNYKRTKNTKVLRAILAALKLLNGEASIDGDLDYLGCKSYLISR